MPSPQPAAATTPFDINKVLPGASSAITQQEHSRSEAFESKTYKFDVANSSVVSSEFSASTDTEVDVFGRINGVKYHSV